MLAKIAKENGLRTRKKHLFYLALSIIQISPLPVTAISTLRNVLLAEHSPDQVKKVAATAAADKGLEKALIALVLSGSGKELQQAARALGYFAEARPEAIVPYLPELIRRCGEAGQADALKRSVSRALQFTELSGDTRDMALDACFGWLEQSGESIATRCFSMTALERMTGGEAELRSALAQLIEHILDYEDCSPGIRSRGRKVLGQIRSARQKRKP